MDQFVDLVAGCRIRQARLTGERSGYLFSLHHAPQDSQIGIGDKLG